MNIYEKLIEVRKEVPYMKKDTKSYQYSYTAGSTILGRLRGKMDELGLLVSPEIIKYDVSVNSKNKPTVALTVNYVWINAEKPSETYTVPFAAFGTQDDISKAFGSALTYSERYFLLKFFSIATDEDDPDSFQEKTNRSKPMPVKPAIPMITQEQINEVIETAKAANIDAKTLAAQYGINSKTTTSEQAKNLILKMVKDLAKTPPISTFEISTPAPAEVPA